MHPIPHRAVPTTHPRRVRLGICRAFAGGARWGAKTREHGRLRAPRADARGLAASGPVPPVGVHRSQGSHPPVPSGHVSPATPSRRLGLAVPSTFRAAASASSRVAPGGGIVASTYTGARAGTTAAGSADVSSFEPQPATTATRRAASTARPRRRDGVAGATCPDGIAGCEARGRCTPSGGTALDAASSRAFARAAPPRPAFRAVFSHRAPPSKALQMQTAMAARVVVGGTRWGIRCMRSCSVGESGLLSLLRAGLEGLLPPLQAGSPT